MLNRSDLEKAVANLEAVLRPPMRITLIIGDADTGQVVAGDELDDGVTVKVVFVHPHGVPDAALEAAPGVPDAAHAAALEDAREAERQSVIAAALRDGTERVHVRF